MTRQQLGKTEPDAVATAKDLQEFIRLVVIVQYEDLHMLLTFSNMRI